MKSSNSSICNKEQLCNLEQLKFLRNRLPRLVILMACVALCAAAAAPLTAQKVKTTPRFVDNGDGTVTDNQTNLIWEKKTESNVNNTYSWSSSTSSTAPDGTLFTVFLATMNCTISSDGTCGLAGHYDWRIPNYAELKTIVDCSKPNCIDPIFGPTINSFYWSATTFASTPLSAWIVRFDGGPDGPDAKFLAEDYARAVRGGK